MKMRVGRKDARQSASSVREKSVPSTDKRLPGVEVRAANPTPAQISSTIRDIAAGVLRHLERADDGELTNKARCRNFGRSPIPESSPLGRKSPDSRHFSLGRCQKPQ